MYEECKNIFFHVWKTGTDIEQEAETGRNHPVFSAYDRVDVRDVGSRGYRSAYYHYARAGEDHDKSVYDSDYISVSDHGLPTDHVRGIWRDYCHIYYEKCVYIVCELLSESL